MNYSTIGINIKKERNKRNITQEQLAEKVGISTNFLACIEVGIKKGSFETYVNIANALHVTLDVLTSEVVYACKENRLKDKLNYCFDNASLTTQELIVKITENITDAYR